MKALYSRAGNNEPVTSDMVDDSSLTHEEFQNLYQAYGNKDKAAINDNNLSVDKFNAVMTAIQEDSDLYTKFQERFGNN